MRVRISYTDDFDRRYRLALAHSWGYHRLATRPELQSHARAVGSSDDEDMLEEWDDEPCDRRGCQP